MRRRLWSLLAVALLLCGLINPAKGLADTQPVPVVLIHGVLGSPDTWTTMVKFLEGKGYVKDKTLFVLDLNANATAGDPGVLADATYSAGHIRQILKDTGAAQVDLVGNSRGGMIVRLLAEGETSAVVRRAVTIDAPHQGVLPKEKLYAIFGLAGLLPSYVDKMLPKDMTAESDTVAFLSARETRFGDRRAAALAIGSTFQDGVDPILAGNDAFVSLESQLAWPGAKTLSFKIGPTAADIAQILQGGFAAALNLASEVPHAVAVDQPAIQEAVYAFLSDPAVKAPARSCDPNCQDFVALTGRWSESTLRPMLPDNLPYSLDAQGNRVFEPTRPMTRAEFVFALDKAVGLTEKFGPTDFADTRSHWALGYVRAAVEAKLVSGLSADSFGPDKPLNRAQAATLVARVKGYPLSDTPSRFADARGHWAEKSIEAAAANGIIKGDERGFRPDDPVTMEEAAVILSRAFPK